MIELKTGVKAVTIDGDNLTLEDVNDVARGFASVTLSVSGKAKIAASRRLVDKILDEGMKVYGITTGFGKFSDVTISREESNRLQKNIIMSHAGGIGEPLPTEVVRAIMLLRANSLAKGYSGVRPEVVELLLAMLNKGVHPVVYSKGSVGASGDLIPLAHVALAMVGMGEVEYRGRIMPSREAFSSVGLQNITLQAKEGLALINGTQYMSALGCLALYDAKQVCKAVAISSCMTFEALEGLPNAFDTRVHEARPHSGQKICAAVMLRLLKGSDLLQRGKPARVQDAYSLRCIPQVHGASLDAINYVQKVLETEINSATDNPLLFVDTEDVISGGNFHGQPLALALDFLAVAVSELGNIAERRLERLVNPALNEGLPPFLTDHGGLNSGLMLLQYAAAALASENKVFSHPASVDSIPTSGNQEDHVSMGSIAALKVRTVLDNVNWIIAGEMFAAAQALDYKGHRWGRGVKVAHRFVRKAVPHWQEDRILYQDLHKMHALLVSGIIQKEVEKECGALCRC